MNISISDFDYDLPDGRIAKFPVGERDASKLLVWRGRGVIARSSETATGQSGLSTPDCFGSSTLAMTHLGQSPNDDGRSIAGEISETVFGNIGSVLPGGSLLIFNNTRVVRARLVMHKPAGGANGVATGGGARIEILCLEPHAPADYERAFAARGRCEWSCMVGNLKKWKSGPVNIPFRYKGSEYKLLAWRGHDAMVQDQDCVIARGEDPKCVIARVEDPKQSGVERPDCLGPNPRNDGAKGEIVRFEWTADLGFGQLLELLGRMPIPPYLGRDSEDIDNTRYQTVYAKYEGSVAAPTAGLHFTPELIERLKKLRVIPGEAGERTGEVAQVDGKSVEFDEVTLHVGAGTFLPVKVENALEHPMHTEHFEVTLATIEHLLAKYGSVIAVGTTSVRTLESLPALAWRIRQSGSPDVECADSQCGRDAGGDVKDFTGNPETERSVGQFESRGIPAEFDGRAALETLAGYMRSRGLDRLAASTRIMITPGFTFRITRGIVTNFHQPKSTLLLLIAAFTGNDEWRKIYDYALSHEFRFLSYGDSSLLLR